MGSPLVFNGSVNFKGSVLTVRGADTQRFIEAPRSILSFLLKNVDGEKTLEDLVQVFSKKHDENTARAFLEELTARKILIKAEAYLLEQWGWQKSPLPYKAPPADSVVAAQLSNAATKKVLKKPDQNEIVMSSELTAVSKILQNRRVYREFGPEPLTDKQIASILYTAYGVLNAKKTDDAQTRQRRTVASGGGVYPLDLVWVHLKDTAGLKRGVYKVNFYTQREIGFQKISSAEGDIFRAVIEPVDVLHAHGFLIIGADFSLAFQKYHSKTLPLCLLEAGEVVQNVQLAVTELGLASHIIAGYYNALLSEVAHFSDVEPVILMAVGTKKSKSALKTPNIDSSWLHTRHLYDQHELSKVKINISCNGKGPFVCIGNADNPLTAIDVALAEGVERLGCVLPKNVVEAKPSEIGTYIDPREFLVYDEFQYGRKDFPFKKFSDRKAYSWVKARHAITGKATHVLADLVYFDSGFEKTNKNPYTATSTSGVAAHITYKKALNNAVLEKLERHFFMYYWLTRSLPPKIKTSSLPKRIQDQLLKIKSSGWKADFFLLSKAPVFSVLVVLQNKKHTVTSASASCHYDLDHAIAHAWREGDGIITYIEGRSDEESPLKILPGQVRSTDDHTRLYQQPEYYKQADWMFGSREEISAKTLKPVCSTLEELLNWLEKHGHPVYHVDQTPSVDVTLSNGNKVYVARALIKNTIDISFGFGRDPNVVPSFLSNGKSFEVKSELFPHFFP